MQQVQVQVPKEYSCCEESDTVRIDIERGVPDGHTFEFEGYGEHNPTQQPGKISWKVQTERNPTFRREGHQAPTRNLNTALLTPNQ